MSTRQMTNARKINQSKSINCSANQLQADTKRRQRSGETPSNAAALLTRNPIRKLGVWCLLRAQVTQRVLIYCINSSPPRYSAMHRTPGRRCMPRLRKVSTQLQLCPRHPDLIRIQQTRDTRREGPCPGIARSQITMHTASAC